jgi:hypothetical protein
MGEFGHVGRRTFRVLVGESSEDIRLRGEFVVK